MFEATQDGLGRNAPVHSIHGSLLAVGELLRFISLSYATKEILESHSSYYCLEFITSLFYISMILYVKDDLKFHLMFILKLI